MDISKIFLNNNGAPNFKPTISFDYNTFIKLFMGDLDDLENSFGWLKKTIGSEFNFDMGSISTRLSNIYGQEFAFSFYGRDLFLWDHSGSTAIGNVQLDDDLKIRKEQINNIIRLTENFTNNIIECGLCDKEINYQENRKHRYFAGIYCEKCYLESIKTIADKENYN